jgi:hypothetical protein
MSIPIQEYEIIIHGIEHSQYFSGCGVSFTHFNDVVTGIGNDIQEAFDNALDMLAQNDWDVSTLKNKSFNTDEYEKITLDNNNEEYFHVSIRVR